LDEVLEEDKGKGSGRLSSVKSVGAEEQGILKLREKRGEGYV